MKKIFIYERRAGGDRRMFPLQRFGNVGHDRRQNDGVLPVIVVPGRMIVPRENPGDYIEH